MRNLQLKNKKKGAALAYVIMLSMMLLVFAAALVSAASVNINLSQKGGDSRQAYVSAKSAIEYTKAIVYQKAKSAYTANVNRENTPLSGEAIQVNSEMQSFMVQPDQTDSSKYKWVHGIGVVDGQTTLTNCKVTLTEKTTIVAKKIINAVQNGSNYHVTAWSQIDTYDKNNQLKESKAGTKTTYDTTAKTESKEEIISNHYIYNYKIEMESAEKFKNSDRIQKLNYQTTCTIGGKDTTIAVPGGTVTVPAKGGSTDFISAGALYGNSWLISDGYSSIAVPKYNQVRSDYPVVIKSPLQLDFNTGWNDQGFFSAPQLYFMGRNSSIKVWEHKWNLKSDFIYVAGTIYGQDYRQSLSEKRVYAGLKLNSYTNNKQGIIYFASDCIIQVDGSKAGDTIGTRTITIEKGYYQFDENTDLFALSNSPQSSNYKYNKLHKLSDGNDFMKDKEYIEQNYTKMISGDRWELNGGANWSWDGNPFFGDPSYHIVTEDMGYLQAGSPFEISWRNQEVSKQIVHWYIDDTNGWDMKLFGSNWENSQNPNKPDEIYYEKVHNVYQAKEINMLYVYDRNAIQNQFGDPPNFTIPAFKTVVFKADTITLNTKRTDAENNDSADDRPAISHEEYALGRFGYVKAEAQFLLESGNGSDKVTLQIPQDLNVKYNGGSYTIQAGAYQVRSGLNLFSSEAKTFFENSSNTGSIGGSSQTVPGVSYHQSVKGFALQGGSYAN